MNADFYRSIVKPKAKVDLVIVQEELKDIEEKEDLDLAMVN